MFLVSVNFIILENYHLFCQSMAFLINFIFLSSWTTVAFTFPHNTFDNILQGSKIEFESSGSRPDEPVQGIVKVVQLDPRALSQSGLFRRGLIPRRAPSLNSRLSFPTFLSQGRPGPAGKRLVSPLHHLHPKNPTEVELKKKQGLQMWQRAIDKGDKITMSLPVNLKDTKQMCTAVPFTQVRNVYIVHAILRLYSIPLPNIFLFTQKKSIEYSKYPCAREYLLLQWQARCLLTQKADYDSAGGLAVMVWTYITYCFDFYTLRSKSILTVLL